MSDWISQVKANSPQAAEKIQACLRRQGWQCLRERSGDTIYILKDSEGLHLHKDHWAFLKSDSVTSTSFPGTQELTFYPEDLGLVETAANLLLKHQQRQMKTKEKTDVSE